MLIIWRANHADIEEASSALAGPARARGRCLGAPFVGRGHHFPSRAGKTRWLSAAPRSRDAGRGTENQEQEKQMNHIMSLILAAIGIGIWVAIIVGQLVG